MRRVVGAASCSARRRRVVRFRLVGTSEHSFRKASSMHRSFFAEIFSVNGSRKSHIFGNRKFLTWSVRSYPQTRCRGRGSRWSCG